MCGEVTPCHAQRAAAAAAVRRSRRRVLAEHAERLRVIEDQLAALTLDALQQCRRSARPCRRAGQKPSVTTMGRVLPLWLSR